ncbi:hypothetical protein [Streptomyces sp. NPDC002588]|uniref:hypothetical protein n=1 Tax=Streptomyces sp. NPDC002588 TaxID=3154419 RepID=UPI00331CB2E6
MPQPNPAARTSDIHLLFAHEPNCPGPGTQEINTTVVAAGTLLHPRSSSRTAPGSTTSSPKDGSFARSSRRPPSPTN